MDENSDPGGQRLAVARRSGPSFPLRDAAARAREPRFNARKVLLEGSPPLKGYPFVLDWFRPTPPSPAPRVGQHNEIIRAGPGGTLREAVEIALLRCVGPDGALPSAKRR